MIGKEDTSALPSATVEPPSITRLVEDLERWRKCGVTQLGSLDLLALRQAALAIGLTYTSAESGYPAVLRELLRRAIAPVAGSVTGRCSLVLLGLDPDTFDLAPHLLREEAADIYGVSLERFRRDPQRRVLTIVAELIAEQCVAHRARLERIQMEQRHPADSRLAVQWLERFEAYFALWTPLYALGADLAAYSETRLAPITENGAPVPDGETGVDPIKQAGGYASFALVHYTDVIAAERRFIARFGGLWLLSSSLAEASTRDALYAVVIGTTMNERDRSWLRTALLDAKGEMDGMLQTLSATSMGRATWDEWTEWLGTCGCAWQPTRHDPSVEYFPTARYHGNIDPACAVHRVIEACNLYCASIEQEWATIADWYGTEARMPSPSE